MTQQTDYNKIILPTPEEISSEDRDEWAKILNNDTFNDYLDELAIPRGPASDRPAADSNKPAPEGSSNPIQRMWVVTDDNDGPKLTISDGVEWRSIGRLAANHYNPRYDSNEDGTIDAPIDSPSVATDELNGGVTGNTALTTIAGMNLSIDSNGALNASGGSSSTTTTLYMSDYVASSDRDGSTAVDTEFETALSDVPIDGTLVFNDGIYQLADSHVITKSITLDSENATVRCTNTTNNNATIEFQGDGIQASTTTSEALVLGEKVIGVSDASPFSVDDRILLMNDAYSETQDSIIQFASVQAVDTTNSQITLYGTTAREFVNGTNVYRIDLLEGPTLRGIETDGGGYRHLQCTWCENPTYDNVKVSEYREVSLYALNCWKPRHISVTATKPTGRASGEGEPLALYRCSDAYVESPRIYKCRRGIDFAWGTHDTTIVDPVIHNFSIGGITVHGGDHCGVFSVTGGILAADPSATTGNAISNTQYAPMHVDGTHILSRRAGLRCLGPTNATNLTIEPTENTNQGQALYIQHSQVNIDNCTINDPTGRFG